MLVRAGSFRNYAGPSGEPFLTGASVLDTTPPMGSMLRQLDRQPTTAISVMRRYTPVREIARRRRHESQGEHAGNKRMMGETIAIGVFAIADFAHKSGRLPLLPQCR